MPPSSGLKWVKLGSFCLLQTCCKEKGHVEQACHPPDCTVLQALRPQNESPQPWKPEILDCKVTFCSQPTLQSYILFTANTAKLHSVHSQHSTFSFWFGGTRWRSWLRHCATSRKVAGSIPDGVIILPAVLWPWGSTQPLREMSTRSIYRTVKVAGA